MIEDNLSWQPIQQKAVIIYEHLARCAELLDPESVINEVRYLFLHGKIETVEVVKALEEIIASHISDREFGKFINSCFHLIINIWLTKSQSREYILGLITVFDDFNPRSKSYNRYKVKLTQLICQYQTSDFYFQLRSLVAVINFDGSKSDTDTQIHSLIPRYPYLYQHYFLENDYINASVELISTIQANNQQKFEFQLSKYIIYQIRLLQAARIRLLSKGAGKAIHRVNNPTLLSDKNFKIAIKHYIGKIDGEHTLVQISQKLTGRKKAGDSYQNFKQELKQYLLGNFTSQNPYYHFDKQLEHKLNVTFSQSDRRVLNNSLILQTCRQLISFLIIQNAQTPNFERYKDLAANLGTAQVVLLLVKILLICPEVKPDLDKKIVLLFNHYQNHKIEEVLWLVKSLEYLVIANSIYFGKVDVSLAKNSFNLG
ncbi:MAG: hypothetical protein ACFCU5_15005 [Pleurocapsa sp.]